MADSLNTVVPRPSPPPHSHSTHVRRPCNSYMLYSAWKRSLKNTPGMGQQETCWGVAESWRKETPEIRLHFTKLAEEENIAHKMQYPDYYKYEPRKRNANKQKETPKANAQPKAKKGGGSSKYNSTTHSLTLDL